MDFVQINKKRKLITLLSITLTILIIGLYVVSLILFARSFVLIPILGAFVVLALLYCLSKFVVYKQYLKIKTIIVSSAIKNDIKCNKIVYDNFKNEFLLHFYSKQDLNSKSKFKLIYDDYSMLIEEFEVTQKRNFKSDKVILAGKYLKVQLNKSYGDYVIIKNFDSESNKYIDYYINQFQKKDDNFAFNRKRYVCLYNEIIDTSILSIFEKINGFHMIKVENDLLEVIFIDNTPVFDFKLQQQINSTMVHAANQCFNKLIKLINSIRKVN